MRQSKSENCVANLSTQFDYIGQKINPPPATPFQSPIVTQKLEVDKSLIFGRLSVVGTRWNHLDFLSGVAENFQEASIQSSGGASAAAASPPPPPLRLEKLKGGLDAFQKKPSPEREERRVRDGRKDFPL